jgi:AraC-like DNA-binding protein
MTPISQSEAVGETLAARERSRFFAARRFAKIECLSATFVTHRFATHTHETYAIGAIERGVERFRVRGAVGHLSHGEIVALNPLDPHDGEPAAGGFAYRMAYPTIELMELVAESVTGRRGGPPRFREPVSKDAEGAALFLAAHRAIEEDKDLLLGEELLLRALGRAVVLFAGLDPVAAPAHAPGIRRVKQVLDEACEEDHALSRLAQLAGTGPHHLIRAFRRETGLTPHAYVINRRIERAKDMLRRGETPGEAAQAVGFCDQAHFTRAFKARLGTTPAAYRAAFAS